MGNLLSSVLGSLARLFGQRECRILVLGLDNAGKTTLLHRLAGGAVEQTLPTVGFNVETLQHKNLKFQVWDLGGQSSIRPYWRYYFDNTSAIVYVVDSADGGRLAEAKRELHLVLAEEELRGVVVVVLANKRDLPGVMGPAEISEQLALPSITDRQYAIFNTSAAKGDGVEEAFDWLADVLSSQ